jgi:hypothetical protein
MAAPLLVLLAVPLSRKGDENKAFYIKENGRGRGA